MVRESSAITGDIRVFLFCFVCLFVCFFTCLSYRELHVVKSLEQKFGPSQGHKFLNFFDKTSVIMWCPDIFIQYSVSLITREFKIRRLRTTATDKYATAHDQNHVTVHFSRVVVRLR